MALTSGAGQKWEMVPPCEAGSGETMQLPSPLWKHPPSEHLLGTRFLGEPSQSDTERLCVGALAKSPS